MNATTPPAAPTAPVFLAQVPPQPSARLAAALEAAEAAARVIRALYQQNVAVQVKADKSPVTEADVQSEKVIRAVLASRFPEDGFFGEETGSERRDAEYLWLWTPSMAPRPSCANTPCSARKSA